MRTINNINAQAENVYNMLNNWLSEGGTTRHLLDHVYPEHDGNPNHEAVADMAIMRQTLYSLQMACEKSIERLAEVIDLYDKNEEMLRKEVEASIRTYPTNVDIFVEGMSFSIDIDFQDSEFFESHDEARDWAEERVSEIEDQFGSKIDNYDDIVDALVPAVDRYTK